MSTYNPLQRFFRQPKIYVSLPSKGLYYTPGNLQGDYNQVPIFAMSGIDELILKTPDALFNGESTIKVIESCVPFVKNAGGMPGLDLDALLIAIRIATYGNILSINHVCEKCSVDNDYDIDLGTILDYFSTLTFVNTITISDEITLNIRPLLYSEISEFGMEHFKLQKSLMNVDAVPEEERNKAVETLYSQLSELQIKLFLTNIEAVRLPDTVVTDKAFIEEWLRNTDKDIFAKIKTNLEGNRDKWAIPSQTIKCAECGHEDQITVVLDQSNFFG